MGRSRTSTSSLGSHALLWVAAFLVALAPLDRAPDTLHDHTNHAVSAHTCAGAAHVSGEREGEGPHPCLSCDPVLEVCWATLSPPLSELGSLALVSLDRVASASALPHRRAGPPPARGPPVA